MRLRHNICYGFYVDQRITTVHSEWIRELWLWNVGGSENHNCEFWVDRVDCEFWVDQRIITVKCRWIRESWLWIRSGSENYDCEILVDQRIMTVEYNLIRDWWLWIWSGSENQDCWATFVVWYFKFHFLIPAESQYLRLSFLKVLRISGSMYEWFISHFLAWHLQL